MQIAERGKPHRVAAWQLHAMRLTISGNHLRCKVTNKYLNVCERVEDVERNKNGLLLSLAAPCESLVPVKENPDRKKKVH